MDFFFFQKRSSTKKRDVMFVFELLKGVMDFGEDLTMNDGKSGKNGER